MECFILRFTGQNEAPSADLSRIRSTPGVKVLDSAPRMVLVQASPETVHRLAEGLPGWTSTREQMTRLPDPRPKLRSS